MPMPEMSSASVSSTQLVASEPLTANCCLAGRWHTSSVGARDGLEKGEPDVPGPQTSRELALAEGPADCAQSLPPDEPNSRGEAYAELRQRVEGGWEPGSFEAPRAELRRFDPERAALPPTSLEAAADYLTQHRAERPWLTAADAASPEARRILVATDAGGGHAHIRHEGWVTEQAVLRRVAYLEDPGPAGFWRNETRGIDGLKPGNQSHRCEVLPRASPTRTHSLPLSAAASNTLRFGRRSTCHLISTRRPEEVTVPIAELLGSDGHQLLHRMAA